MSDAKTGSSLQALNITKRYGSHVALQSISLDVQAGEFMTFLGPSGSGKSTFLALIAGLSEPSDGSLQIDGQSVTGLRPEKRNLGVVFQQYALFPHMSVAENIAYPLKRRGIAKQRVGEMVAAAIQQVQLNGYEERFPSQLSGGQQQRVAVARAIVYQPRILLMDEPLGALDRKMREELQLQLSRLHREVRSTFIYVTHDQEEALALSDRITVFKDGAIEQVGTAHELYESPLTLFVAQFLGESNTISGTLVDGRFVSSGLGDFRPSLRKPSSVTAMIVRPEHMRLHTSDERVSADANAISATVTDIVYLGSSRKVLCRRADGEVAIVRENLEREKSIEPGDPVQLSWKPEQSALVSAN